MMTSKLLPRSIVRHHFQDQGYFIDDGNSQAKRTVEKNIYGSHWWRKPQMDPRYYHNNTFTKFVGREGETTKKITSTKSVLVIPQHQTIIKNMVKMGFNLFVDGILLYANFPARWISGVNAILCAIPSNGIKAPHRQWIGLVFGLILIELILKWPNWL